LLFDAVLAGPAGDLRRGGRRAGVAAARGQQVQASIDTGTEMVTKENVSSFG